MNNSITLSGNVGSVPTLINVGSSKFRVFSLAQNKLIKNKETGEYENSEPDWFDVIVFGFTSENVRHLKKGDKVLVQGHLKPVAKEIEGKKYFFNKIIGTRVLKITKITDPVVDMLPSLEEVDKVPF